MPWWVLDRKQPTASHDWSSTSIAMTDGGVVRDQHAAPPSGSSGRLGPFDVLLP